ncbi:G-type lectin S-receptor-like serine/threonine-protein kinase At1g11330 isoform X2 [Quercus robur]|uniref:G-type lectin S-receptor-like serine/threonine-protein kinase At1g11330 isoform X2 n=1 Tax=Quercus robur TaxID=38942 RepID=UPI002163AC51|nr:G-type lectin S-receptor-like serine/threonine-protein kinase At1g11330 isoform X2 [Quercus robur]
MGCLSRSILLSVLCGLCLNLGVVAVDTIRSSQFIKDKDSDYMISNGSVFKLGFFSPVNSTNRYLGIWYNNISAFTIVWVANRQKPLNDSSGLLTISKDGNVVVLNGQKEILWSSNVNNSIANSSAQLLDSGNLVLKENTIGTILWESFKNPSDTSLPEMKLSTNERTGEKVQLTSWKSPSNPSIGSFSVGISRQSLTQAFIWKDGRPYFRSGPWNGLTFIGTQINSVFRDRYSLVDNQDGTSYLTTTSVKDSLSHTVLTTQGNTEARYWDSEKKDWKVVWKAMLSVCDVYGTCGAFGSCNSMSSPICSCLEGFEPKNTEEWNRQNWTSGCVRRTLLQCGRVNTSGEAGKMDGFSKLNMMKVPDFAEWSAAQADDCRQQCLQNCSCIAYAFDSGIGCMTWTRTLIDTQKFSNGSGDDLYIRVAHLELDTNGDVRKIVTITVIIGTIFISIFMYLLWRWIAKHKARRKKEKEILMFNREACKKFPSEDMLGDNLNQVKVQELPVFNFVKLASATNNFHESNMLGQGGFGPVYRGKFSDAQEIAIKRLSKTSGQGLEEFMNEVVVISKLQHRNLVRLLGCCVEGEERMLIYEYMPNKSLDAFLFDSHKEILLDWRKRFNIIEGIGRDFGMARIFRSNEDQANTNRVVGTYGYMSPEYAMEGRFSEKSDVFSFGVLLLEIVSGRKNSSFYHDEQSMSLLGHAWKLWKADNILALIDPMISEPCYEMEILRCIHVGLLCVQEFAKDRPTTSTVISMLKSEIVDLPHPKKPAFTEREIGLDTESSKLSQRKCSVNNVTITMIQGR